MIKICKSQIFKDNGHEFLCVSDSAYVHKTKKEIFDIVAKESFKKDFRFIFGSRLK